MRHSLGGLHLTLLTSTKSLVNDIEHLYLIYMLPMASLVYIFSSWEVGLHECKGILFQAGLP